MPSVAGQDRFARLSSLPGFSQSITYAVAQDSLGNIWTATEEGIIRYNSQEAFAYRAGAGLPEEFGGRIRTLHVTSRGGIWGAGERGVARYDPTLDTFLPIRGEGKLSINLPRTLLGSAKGDLWIAAFNGLWRLAAGEERATRVLEVRNPTTLLLINEHRLLIGAEAGLYDFNTEELSFRGPLVLTQTELPAITALARSGEKVWLGTQAAGLWLTDTLLTKSVRVLPTPMPPILDLLPGEHESLWMATDGEGIWELSAKGDVQRRYRSDVNRATSLASDGVYDLLKDREGILWAATYGGGLHKLDPYANTFGHLRHIPNDVHSIGHPFTRTILEDEEGKVWFGTKDGISIWDRGAGRWSHQTLRRAGERKAIVMDMVEEGNYVWAATFQGELYRVRKSDLRYTERVFAQGNDRQRGRLFSLAAAPNGLWAGGINMDLYQLSEGESPQHFPVQQVRDVMVDDLGSVWVANREGLAKLTDLGADAGAKIAWVNSLKSGSFAGRYSTLTFIEPMATGFLLGSSGAGLLFADRNGVLLGQLTEADGLPSNLVQSLEIDEEGQYWLGTSRGLARVRIMGKDTLLRVFDEADGLAGTEFNYGASARLRDGTLLFGGPTGVSYFHPATITDGGQRPTVILEDLLLMNERQMPGDPSLPAHLNTLDELVLAYDQNAVTLRFAAVSHVAGEAVTYRHRLVGLNEEWSEANPSRQTNYTNLESGTYLFEVQAAVSPDNWGETRQLLLKVQPPWWLSWWAYLLYALLLAAVVYAGYRYSRALIRRRNAERQVDFFNNVTHEIKTPLAILLASLEEVTEEEGAKDEVSNKIRGTIKRLSSLFDQLLNFHKASGSRKSRHVKAFDPATRLENITDRFAPLLKKRELSLELLETDSPVLFHYDTDIFDKIVFNLVSNAVKYSKAGGRIELRLGRKGTENLELEVADEGIGIPADQQKYILAEYYRARNAVNSQLPGTGLGLMMVKKMVEREGGSIRFVSKENVGTTFYLQLADRRADLALVPSPAPASAPPEEQPATNDGLSQILLVEDNDELRESLARRLGRYFRVTTAANGHEGLARAAEIFPDLIITDFIMPEMDGLEMSQALQANIQLNHIPVFMLTVLQNSEQKVTSISTGISEYLEKPVNFELLLAKANNTLNWRKKLRERYVRQDEAELAATHRDERENAFIRDLEDFTRSQFTNDQLSVQDLCQHVGMSRTSLYMKLKNLVDLSPQDFIIHLRLTEAKRLLTETDTSIKGVAYDCGFANPKYFSTSFKKKFGESPGSFRKRLRAG